jgi:hypothetical protein
MSGGDGSEPVGDLLLSLVTWCLLLACLLACLLAMDGVQRWSEERAARCLLQRQPTAGSIHQARRQAIFALRLADPQRSPSVYLIRWQDVVRLCTTPTARWSCFCRLLLLAPRLVALNDVPCSRRADTGLHAVVGHQAAQQTARRTSSGMAVWKIVAPAAA